MWRRTSLLWINGALWLGILVLAVVYRGELRWAADALPTYLDASIRSPEERRLYRRARRILRDDGADLSAARPLLERSVAIDPYGEGYYWLGRYHDLAGEDELALEAYERFLAFDRTVAEAYLHVAAIHRRAGRNDDARDVLERGLDYFVAYAERFRPRETSGVERRFAEKAFETYGRYRSAVARLQQALLDLDAAGEADAPPTPPAPHDHGAEDASER